MDPHWLEFELTETAVMQQPEQVLMTMDGITGLGLRFSLDDFGTGFSSFVHLHSLPINLLKSTAASSRRLPSALRPATGWRDDRNGA
ncbi:EAL domain-containing protein [Halopseudomonas pachastrellae]|nr:EAL domain-containing protein [Halopseudomonas pachastrellae]